MVVIDDPSELVRKAFAELLPLVRLAVLFKDGVFLLPRLNVFPHAVIIPLFRSREIDFGSFEKLETDSTGFYFLDLVLVLDVIPEIDVGHLDLPGCNGIEDLLLHFFLAHGLCVKKMHGHTGQKAKSANLELCPVYPYKVLGTYYF